MGDEAAGEPRVERLMSFERENQTALDGSIAWKALVETGKAFELDAFSRKALIHNLRDDDYVRRWVRCGTCSGSSPDAVAARRCSAVTPTSSATIHQAVAIELTRLRSGDIAAPTTDGGNHFGQKPSFPYPAGPSTLVTFLPPIAQLAAWRPPGEDLVARLLCHPKLAVLGLVALGAHQLLVPTLTRPRSPQRPASPAG